MINCLVYDTVREEREQLRQLLHREAAYAGDDEWNMKFPETRGALNVFLREGNSIDFLCLDITSSGILKSLAEIREKYQEAHLLLIADTDISPLEYLRPGIRPDALVLRPCDMERVQKTLREFLRLLRMPAPIESEYFLIETRRGQTRLPYEKILYFESKEKKIFARAGRYE